MPFNFTIPISATAVPRSLIVPVEDGDVLFILGANGTGKSSIMSLITRSQTNASVRRISAHRQTWLESNALTMTGENRRSLEQGVVNHDRDPSSRWRDNFSSARSNAAIYDLIDAENIRNRQIAQAVDTGDINLARRLSESDSPIKTLNELLRLSNLPIEVSVIENEQIMASKSGGRQYSVAQLSDGERNALLIAANVLTVRPGTLLLIDEPERHLHRSIISPLLTHLFAKRPDCTFIISTHEIMLPLDNPAAKTLLVRDCAYADTNNAVWDANLVPVAGIDENLRKDILGSRKKILFIEGTESSLDKALYSLIFPNISIVAKEGCHDVRRAVLGIRDAAEFHWVNAFGIIDNDRRPTAEVNQLKAEGVYALTVFSVESIYYHPDIQQLVLARHAAVTGGNPAALLTAARTAALTSVIPHIQRLSERTAEKAIRADIMTQLPGREEIAAGTRINISIDVTAAVNEERNRLQNFVDTSDLGAIIKGYPIRETPALGQIASTLGFQDRKQYEAAVRKLLIDDPTALTLVRGFFGDLQHALDA